MTNNNQAMVYPDAIQRRGELRRSSAVNYHQTKFKCVNLSRDCQQQRPITENYELSEDLNAIKIEYIEKKYGGQIISHRSARIIQSSYREYRLRRDYKKLKIEKRASRKLDLPTLNYSNQTFKSPSNPGSPETILEVATMDMKKQSSYEDLVIEQAYQDWDKKLETSRSENSNPSGEGFKGKFNEEKNCFVNADSGVDSVDASSVSLTPSPTNAGIFSIISPSTSLVISKMDGKFINKSNNSQSLNSSGSINDQEANNYIINKSIPISHSSTLCDHKEKMISSTYRDEKVSICCDLNNSFHAPTVSPKLIPSGTTCYTRSHNQTTKYRCAGSSKFASCAVPGYLSNPRLFGSDFQKTCFCQSSNKKYKRLYRICLNIFNKNSLKGIIYLIKFNFLEPQPDIVAKFLMTRKGVSRSGIGDYLGQTKEKLAMETLKYFVRMVDMKNKEIDVALRHLLSLFHIPGESQKITCIMEEFQRAYIEQNIDYCKRFFKHIDAIMILAYAIIMLHTDLYNPNVRINQKMTKEEFVRNLRKADDGKDIDSNLLNSIYDRIKTSEMKTFPDHTDQVRKIDQHFSGDLRPRNLVQPHRRLVCYCRLFEVTDSNKKDRSGAHQREVFLFNDILVITKAVQKRKKEGVMYQCRIVINLSKVEVYLFENSYYPSGIQIKRDNEVLAILNTRTLADRQRFVEDLVETVEEVSEMDRLRIEEELVKQQRSTKSNTESSSEVTLRKHTCVHTSDQTNQKKETISDPSLKKREILTSGQSKSISSEDCHNSPGNRHRRSASIGSNVKKDSSKTYSPDHRLYSTTNQPNVYNEENRISGDSGLQEDLE